MDLDRERLGWHLRAMVDLFTYVVVLTGVALVISLVLSVATGGAAVRAKAFLFVIGWVLMAYATVLLWPSQPPTPGEKPADESQALPAEEASRFQGIVRSLPPVRWIELPPPHHRISLATQLFIGSVCILLTSYLMETVFNVA